MKRKNGGDKCKTAEKALTILLIVCALLGTTIPLVLGQFNLSLLSVYMSVPMLSAAVLWKAIRNRDNNNPGIRECDSILNINENSNANLPSVLLLIFLTDYIVSVLLLHFFPVRPVYYYLLVGTMGVTVLLQILYVEKPDKKQIHRILLQIILLFLNILWGVTLKYYFFIGRTDGMFHSWVIENLLKDGTISQAFDIYDAFPLWHILCSFIYQITGLSVIPAKVMFLTNGLIYGCLVLVVYLIASRLFNTKIALLSSLFLCFNTEAVFYGMYSIPRSVIFFLESLLIILLLQQKSVLNTCLCIFITMGLIMYHTASMPFILAILVLFYILQTIFRVERKERFLNLNFLLLIFVLTVTYWMYAGIKVFDSIAGSLVVEASTGTLTKSIVETPLSELFNYLQYSPLLFFILLGVLWGLRDSGLKRSSKVFLFISLLLVPVTLPGPALLINKLAGNFNLSRFGEYSFLFLCIAGAAGLCCLFGRLKTKARIPVILLFFCMAFLAVSNDFTASDNPLVKRPFYTYYLTESEAVSLKTAAKITDSTLMTDYIACRYLESSEYADKVHILEADPVQKIFLRESGSEIIAVRTGELVKRPLKLFTSKDGKFLLNPSLRDTLDYYYTDSPVWDTLDSYNTIYDSGSVKLYQ